METIYWNWREIQWEYSQNSADRFGISTVAWNFAHAPVDLVVNCKVNHFRWLNFSIFRFAK